MRRSSGAQLFRFYGDVNRLRLAWPALRSRNIDVVYVHNANRVLAFRRWDDHEHFLIIASLNDRPFDQGYTIFSDRLWDGPWQEIFNSDAADFGGNNVGNDGGTRSAGGGHFTCTIPFHGFVIFRHIVG